MEHWAGVPHIIDEVVEDGDVLKDETFLDLTRDLEFVEVVLDRW
jgi:hypothetical protein